MEGHFDLPARGEGRRLSASRARRHRRRRPARVSVEHAESSGAIDPRSRARPRRAGGRAASPTATPLSPRSKARSPPASSATGSTIPTISAASKRSLRSCGLWSCSKRRRQAPGTSMCSRPSPSSGGEGSAWRCSASPKRKRGAKERRRSASSSPARTSLRRGSTKLQAMTLCAAEPIFAFPGCPHGGDWVLMVKPLPAGA